MPTHPPTRARSIDRATPSRSIDAMNRSIDAIDESKPPIDRIDASIDHSHRFIDSSIASIASIASIHRFIDRFIDSSTTGPRDVGIRWVNSFERTDERDREDA